MIPHAKIPGRVMLGEPKPDDSFVDNTVYRYKMINGEKVLIGTQDPFPEGWFDPEGWRRTKTGEEENDMGKQREIPTYPELLKAFQESGYKIAPVKREFKIHWNTAQRWLFDAGLIDENGKPTDKAKPKQMFSKEEATPMETAIEETSKGEEVLDSIDAGKKPKATDEKCRNCGRTIPGDEVKYWHRGWMCNECAGSVLDASLKPDEAVKAESHDHHINAEPPDASPDEFNAGEVSHAMPDNQTPVCEPVSKVKGRELCVACGEIADFKVDGKWYCYKHEQAGSQYGPEDNDYQDEIEQAVTQAAEKNFKRQRFLLEVITNIIELAEVRRVPAELTVELIDAVLVVA